ncbi:MAG: ABC transporter ATP-binding protein [Rubrivivax sp.]
MEAASRQAGGTPGFRVQNKVKIVGVSHRFNNVAAVNNVSLNVRTGEFLTLLGSSGSGKTTLLRIIAGLQMPSEGQVLLDGKDITYASPQEREIGFIFQQYALFPHLSVFDNIAYPLRVRAVGKAETKDRVEQALARVNLPGVGSRFGRELSGGQQQRIAIARALVYEPAVLLMDEPLGALDRRLRVHMQVELRQLQRRLGLTCIYVTHDQDEALTMSDRIGVMRDGRLIQIAEPQDLYRNPADHHVASFVGETNLFPCDIRQVDAQMFDVTLAERESTARTRHAANTAVPLSEGPALLAVRPEALTLDGIATDFAVDATVVETLFLGNVAVVLAESQGGTRLRVQIPAVDHHRYVLGDAVRVGWSFADSRVLPAAATAASASVRGR